MTLPIQLFEYLQWNFDPTAAAVSTLSIIVTAAVVLLTDRLVRACEPSASEAVHAVFEQSDEPHSTPTPTEVAMRVARLSSSLPRQQQPPSGPAPALAMPHLAQRTGQDPDRLACYGGAYEKFFREKLIPDFQKETGSTVQPGARHRQGQHSADARGRRRQPAARRVHDQRGDRRDPARRGLFHADTRPTRSPTSRMWRRVRPVSPTTSPSPAWCNRSASSTARIWYRIRRRAGRSCSPAPTSKARSGV